MTAASFSFSLSGGVLPEASAGVSARGSIRPARLPCAVTMTGQSIRPAHSFRDGGGGAEPDPFTAFLNVATCGCVVVANDNLSSLLARFVLPAGHLGVRFGAAAFLPARRRLPRLDRRRD